MIVTLFIATLPNFTLAQFGSIFFMLSGRHSKRDSGHFEPKILLFAQLQKEQLTNKKNLFLVVSVPTNTFCVC